MLDVERFFHLWIQEAKLAFSFVFNAREEIVDTAVRHNNVSESYKIRSFNYITFAETLKFLPYGTFEDLGHILQKS